MMRWPFWGNKDEESPPPSEATRARIQAEKALKETRDETPMYRDLAASLRAVRIRNHLGDAMEHNFRGGTTR